MCLRKMFPDFPISTGKHDQYETMGPSVLLKGKWQQKFLSSYLKETPKQCIQVNYRIFISALFGEIF